MEKTGKTMKRNHFIDVLKGLCILYIIISHYAWSDAERLRYGMNFINPVCMLMVISGYLYSRSFAKRGISSLGEAYAPALIADRLLRFTVPFAAAFLLEVVYIGFDSPLGLKELVRAFLSGGYGPGGYYYPIMLQFVFFYPLIHFIIRKHEFRGWIAKAISSLQN